MIDAIFDRSRTSSYWCSTVTMALSCIIFEIKRDLKNRNLFISHLHSTPLLRGTASKFRRKISYAQTRMAEAVKCDDACSRFSTIHERDRQTYKRKYV